MAQDATAHSLLELLHRASQRADYVFAHTIGENGLTPRQFVVLHAVSKSDGLSQTDIMAATGIDRSIVSEVEHRTFSRNYALKRDQRVLYVTERRVFHLTHGGLELIEVAPVIDIDGDNPRAHGLRTAKSVHRQQM